LVLFKNTKIEFSRRVFFVRGKIPNSPERPISPNPNHQIPDQLCNQSKSGFKVYYHGWALPKTKFRANIPGCHQSFPCSDLVLFFLHGQVRGCRIKDWFWIIFNSRVIWKDLVIGHLSQSERVRGSEQFDFELFWTYFPESTLSKVYDLLPNPSSPIACLPNQVHQPIPPS